MVAPQSLDRAVAALEMAHSAAPTDAGLLNDLSAGYLLLAEEHQALVPLLKSLNAVRRSVALDSTSQEAAFNQALIFEALHLVDGARRAWRQYLVLDDTSAWSADARAHLHSLASRGDDEWWRALGDSVRSDALPAARMLDERVQHSPQSAREFSFGLLKAWGVARSQRDVARATALLEIDRRIVFALARSHADTGVALALAVAVAASGDNERAVTLGAAHATLADGLTLYASAGYDSAAALLAIADADLTKIKSPAARWARLYRAGAEVNRGYYALADTLLYSILREATPSEPALIGKATWALGVSQLRRGAYESANRLYRDAEGPIARSREEESAGALAYVLAEGLSLSGQTAEGRIEALRGLRLLAPFRRSPFLGNHLSTVAVYARMEGLPHASMAIMDEVLGLARVNARPQTVAWAHRARARDLIALERFPDARADLVDAQRWIDRIPSGRGRDRVEADVRFVSAQIELRTSPARAVALLQRVVAAYRALHTDLSMIAGLGELANAAMAANDRVLARRTFDSTIVQIESQQRSFQSADARASFYETLENVFDGAVALALAEGRSRDALDYVERARIALRGSSRHDTVSTGPTTPPSLEILSRTLADSVVIVEYAVLRDKIVAWRFQGGVMRHYDVHVPRDSLARLVALMGRELRNREADVRSASSHLFEILIRPLDLDLRRVRRVAVIPDRELFRVPFAALWSRSSGRYLVEDVEVATLPSGAFLLSAATSKGAAITGAPILVVGDPSGGSSSGLPPLPGAAAEAREISQIYDGSQLLADSNATRTRVVTAMEYASVFHFAGHAIADAEHPERSYLAFARIGTDKHDDSWMLRAGEIGRLRLSNMRLAILSGCSTLDPRGTRSGPIAGLAFSFLRAGVPATVSTLWSVNDDLTTPLLVDFHRARVSGHSASRALRLAQLRALRSGRAERHAPFAWAAFIYTGP